MKLFFSSLTLLASLCMLSSIQVRADKTGNGGEPIAQQFVVLAKKLAVFYKENPFNAPLPFSAETFQQKVDAVAKSLNDDSAKALLECTDNVLYDASGVEKAALFYRETSSIRLNRKAWMQYENDPEARLALVTMEISGLSGVKIDRYETALALVRGHGAVILSIPLESDKRGGSNASEGMRIVGQDSDRFNHITALDVVIDGGVLGVGDESNQRAERFLNDPRQDKEWYTAILDAWVKHRPVYLLLAGPDGNTASITAIYPAVWSSTGRKGVGAYSLFFVKHRQIYEGACVGDAKDLKALDRLTNCFMQSKHYYAYDQLNEAQYEAEPVAGIFGKALQKTMAGLKKDLIFFFAEDLHALEAAVRDNFIPNYSSLVSGIYKQYVLDQALRAYGFEPSLVGPFKNAPYWVKTKNQNVNAVRSYAALKALAEADLGFIDSGTVCTLGDQRDEGPKLIPIEKLKSYQRGFKSACVSIYHWRPYNQDKELFPAMVKAGFYFEYDSKVWLRDSSSVLNQSKQNLEKVQ